MHRIFVLSAPSGTGKTTIAAELKKRLKDLHIPVTYTTKQPRPEEKDGRDYHFVTPGKFRRMVREGKFIEWAEVYGNYYGTPGNEVLDNIKRGKRLLLTIDTQGGLKIKKLFPGALLIGILPPSLAEQEARIRKRSRLSEGEIRERMEAARKERKVLFSHYDVRFINRDFLATARKIAKVINKSSEK